MLRGAVLGLALVVGVVAWLATGDSEEQAPTVESESRIVVAGELGNIESLVGHPVYWAGPVPGAELEVTESGDGSVQVRYLDDPAEAGQESAEALTVGSYPLADPAKALDSFAKRPGSIVRRSRDGREVVTSRESPTSAYFVSPDNSVQVEVYDPASKRALGLALSGRVRPAG